MDAELVFSDKVVFDDARYRKSWCAACRPRSWQAAIASNIGYFYGFGGRRLIGYDNELGKGGHRHIEGLEDFYDFRSWETLIDDFLADIARMRTKSRRIKS